MNRKRCPVCDGRRKVTLRHYPPFDMRAPIDDAPDMMTATVSSKEYPCPECAPHTSEDRVALLTFGVSINMYDRYARDPKYIEAIERDCAHQMADHLHGKRFIKFDVTQPAPMMAHMRGTIGVVSPNVVASMQERIAENVPVVGMAVAEAAAAEVRVWGSHYTGDEGGISKAQAVDAIYRGLKKVLEKAR